MVGMVLYALKGQKLLAQGNALGKNGFSVSPCKGKSIKIVQMYNAFALSGRIASIPFTQGVALG